MELIYNVPMESNQELFPNNSIIPTHYTPSWVVNKGYKIGLDQYYTKEEIASYCYESLLGHLGRIKIKHPRVKFIEPSAGMGSFYKLLPPKKRVGFDIEPQYPGILKQNFFSFVPDADLEYIAVGNPPFGARAWMALAFMNHCAEFCKAVGFILPMYFASVGKGSAQGRVKGLKLIHSEELPDNIFMKKDGTTVDINTVFQIWVKEREGRKPPNLRELLKDTVEVYTVCTNPSRRCGLARMKDYSCFLQSTYYKEVGIVDSFDKVKYSSGYGIIIKRDKSSILQALHTTQWDKYSLRATNHCKHLGMASIFQALIDSNAVSV